MKVATLNPQASNSNSRRLQADAAVDSLAWQLRELHCQGALELPSVGGGNTVERHIALYEFGRRDLSLARVIEAHTDAIAILSEAGCTPRADALYGVWASDGPGSQLYIEKRLDGELVLTGTKRYCSGSLFLDAALVTAHHNEGLLMVDVPLDSGNIVVDTSEWVAPAFKATATGTVEFRQVPVTAQQIVGDDFWYLHRPGFWHGAVGPAACWAGGAAGLVDAACGAKRNNPHSLAHLGALEAAAWGMVAVLDRAGREIDADPKDATENARSRALSVRHLIERACMDVLDRFGRATGPALLAYNAQIAQRYSELALYIRQCQAERDLQALAE